MATSQKVKVFVSFLYDSNEITVNSGIACGQTESRPVTRENDHYRLSESSDFLTVRYPERRSLG
jgi:hypothetical protein